VSIVDSSTERAEAEAKLAANDVEQLTRDLVWWTGKRLDHVDEYNDLTARRGVVEQLHAEAATWIALIGEELRKRRDGRAT
jgi:hypothetical protein